MSVVFDGAMRAQFSEEVVKSHTTARAATVEAKRITLAPVYAPNRKDAHGEYVLPDDLEEAVIEFAKSGERRLMLQHGDYGTNVHVGDILAVFTWPFEVTCNMTTPRDGKVRKAKFPPGTCWLWAQWDAGKSWDAVRTGVVQGLSMGGRASRKRAPLGLDLPHMGDVHKAGRVLSQKNVDDLKACIATIEEIISRDPQAAQERGMAKSKDGVLVVHEDEEVVYHLTPDRIEVLGP